MKKLSSMTTLVLSVLALTSTARAENDKVMQAIELGQAKDSEGNVANKVGAKTRPLKMVQVKGNSLSTAGAALSAQYVSTKQGVDQDPSLTLAPTSTSTFGLTIEADGELALATKDIEEKGAGFFWAPLGFEGKADLSFASAPSDQIRGKFQTSGGVIYTNHKGEIILVGPLLALEHGASNYGKTGAVSAGGRLNIIGQRGYLNVNVATPIRGRYDGGSGGLHGKIQLGGKLSESVEIGVEANIAGISNRETKLDGPFQGSESVDVVETKIFAGVAF